MLKLFKYLKGSSLPIAAILTFLFLQAFCDLLLPAYTSDIVNIGIQQGGIQDAVPTEIRKSEFERLKLYMPKEDALYVGNSYYSGNSINGKEVVSLKKVEDESRNKLNEIFGKAIILSTQHSNPALLNPGITTAPNSKIELPDTLIKQIAVDYVRREYLLLSIDLNRLQTDFILRTGIKMAILALFSMLFSVLVVFLSARVAASLSRTLRDKIFQKVLFFSNVELDRFSTASLITRSTNDIQQIQLMMTMIFRFVFYAPILAIGGIILALRTNLSMAWVIALGVGSILILIMTLMATAMPSFKKLQTLIDKLNLVTREILSGISVIRAFGTQRHEEGRFDLANMNFIKTNLFVNRVMTFMMPTMMLIMNAITVLIIYTGAHAIDTGTIQVGDMMAFIQYTMQIIMSFFMISMLSIMLPRASVSAKRINEVLDTQSTITDPTNPIPPKSTNIGAVEFRNVYFSYPNAKEYVLSDISFVAKRGETTAIIGSTGSGKTTLINLIPRFYDVTQGKVLINGIDVRDMSLQDLRAKIGLVPQKGVLFSGTITSNLSFGKEDANKLEIQKAAQIAQATDFIEEKEEKYMSPIAQGGINISGGQKQRLAIARAIAKQPEIYIFDDSFSALDYRTDVNLRRALKSETTTSITIIVAQRINTIINSEQIIVLDQGVIVGAGIHKDLLESCKVYREIALSQLSKEELGFETNTL